MVNYDSMLWGWLYAVVMMALLLQYITQLSEEIGSSLDQRIQQDQRQEQNGLSTHFFILSFVQTLLCFSFAVFVPH